VVSNYESIFSLHAKAEARGQRRGRLQETDLVWIIRVSSSIHLMDQIIEQLRSRNMLEKLNAMYALGWVTKGEFDYWWSDLWTYAICVPY